MFCPTSLLPQVLWGMAKRAVRTHGRRKRRAVQRAAVAGGAPLRRICKSLTLPFHGHDVLHWLQLRGAPLVLIALVWLIGSSSLLRPCIDHVEMFAGCQSITRGYLRASRRAVPLEIKLDPTWGDILSPAGFCHALHMVLLLVPGSAIWAAPVCSTWTFMNRGTSCRKPWRPLGLVSVPSVRQANIMVSRVAMLCKLADNLGSWWCLEQPRGSLLERHPRIAQLIASGRVWRTSLNMADFGGSSLKPLWVYSNRQFVHELAEWAQPVKLTDPTKLAKVYIDSAGRKRVQGTSELKASQAYPDRLGEAAAGVFLRHEGELKKAHAESVAQLGKAAGSGLQSADADPWADADLAPVFDFLAE